MKAPVVLLLVSGVVGGLIAVSSAGGPPALRGDLATPPSVLHVGGIQPPDDSLAPLVAGDVSPGTPSNGATDATITDGSAGTSAGGGGGGSNATGAAAATKKATTTTAKKATTTTAKKAENAQSQTPTTRVNVPTTLRTNTPTTVTTHVTQPTTTTARPATTTTTSTTVHPTTTTSPPTTVVPPTTTTTSTTVLPDNGTKTCKAAHTRLTADQARLDRDNATDAISPARIERDQNAVTADLQQLLKVCTA